MGKQTKFIILIVEGSTDQDVYEMMLTSILEGAKTSKQIRCRCTEGDLFSRRNVEIHNLKNHIRDEAKNYLDRQHLNISDIEAVIQICDIDGIFFSKEQFVDNNGCDDSYGYCDGKLVRYYDPHNIDQLYEIYQKKKQMLDAAKCYTSIKINKKEIPYRLFYQSLFLENLIDSQFINSNDKNRKNEIVDEFLDKLSEMEEEELAHYSTVFFDQKQLKDCDNYADSWYLLNNKNCLSVSNLSFLIHEIIDS